tara:strand:- start:240 stop:395 length:156 start_codon:yes stop_codon:yes gene_type:complete
MENYKSIELDHQLEKLEFALAVSQTFGDEKKSEKIKHQIEVIGYKYQEPGT